MQSLYTAVTIVAACLAIIGSPVDGKWWNVEAGGTRGYQTISLDLLEKDGSLIGTVKEFTAQPRDISNGKVTGNFFKFETAGLMNGRDITVIWFGEVNRDEMILKRQIQFDDGRIVDAPNSPLRMYRNNARR
jgi:hypothetical protein